MHLKFTSLLLYFSLLISALTWISSIIGFIMRKLNGLEAMFVVQFSWLVFLWLNNEFVGNFINVWPLKYSVGYNHPFSGVTEE
jgi:hypothetical protein